MKARMKSRLSRRIITFLGCIVAAGAASAAIWNSHSTEPESWFNVPSLWSNELYPQSGESVTIYPQENGTAVKNGTAVVYIPEGSNVTGIASINLGESGVTHSELQVRPEATLAYTGGLGTPSGGTTAVVVNGGDLQGGSMTVGKGGKFTLIATNGANVQITGGTFAWQHATDIRLEDATFTKTTSGNLILGNSSSYQMNLFAKRSTLSLAKSGQGKGVELGDNGGANTRGAIYLEDSTLTTDGRLRMGRGHNNCAIRLTNSVFAVNYGSSESNLGSEVSSSKTDSGKTNYVDVVGSKSVFSSAGYINAHGNLKLTVADSAQLTITNTGNGVSWSSTVPEGSVQQYLFSNSTVRLTSRTSYNGKMEFSGAGEVRMRQYGGSLTAKSITSAPKLTYELENGILDLRGWAYPEEGKDVFNRTSFHGSRLVLKGANQEYRCHILMNKKTQYVYEIDRTGFNPIKQGKDAGNSNNWVRGAMTVKLTGGLQLLQRKSVEFFHSYNLAGDLGAFDTEEGAFVDPNPQLWACGPHRDPSTFETYGPFKGTGKMGANLKDAAEIAAGVLYDAGRSCGWLKLPKVREALEKPAKVSLDLVPQGDVTLQELIDGFTAAGYPAKALPAGGDYNVQLEVAPELVQAKNPDETIVFDFNEYPDRTACLNGTPTVRALVRRANVEVPQKGLILLLR